MKKMFMQSLVITILLLGMGGLTGCGIKPASVEPPTDSTSKVYPRTYPSQETEPAPKGPIQF